MFPLNVSLKDVSVKNVSVKNVSERLLKLLQMKGVPLK